MRSIIVGASIFAAVDAAANTTNTTKGNSSNNSNSSNSTANSSSKGPVTCAKDNKITWETLSGKKLTAAQKDHNQVAICLATELINAAKKEDMELTAKNFGEYLDKCGGVDDKKKFKGRDLEKINLTSKPPSMPASAKINLDDVTFSLLAAKGCIDLLALTDDLVDDDAVKSTPAVVAFGLALSSIFMA